MANCSTDEILPHWKFSHRHSQGVCSAIPAAVSSLGLNGGGATATVPPPHQNTQKQHEVCFLSYLEAKP